MLCLVLHFYVLVKAKYDLSYFYNIIFQQKQQIYFTSKYITRNNKNEKEEGNI